MSGSKDILSSRPLSRVASSSFAISSSPESIMLSLNVKEKFYNPENDRYDFAYSEEEISFMSVPFSSIFPVVG